MSQLAEAGRDSGAGPANLMKRWCWRAAQPERRQVREVVTNIKGRPRGFQGMTLNGRSGLGSDHPVVHRAAGAARWAHDVRDMARIAAANPIDEATTIVSYG